MKRSSNMPATTRPSASTTCTCTRKTRSARSSGIRSTSTRRRGPARRRHTGDRGRLQGRRAAPTAPGRRSTAKGMFRIAPSRRRVRRCCADLVRQPRRTAARRFSAANCRITSALSVTDLDAWINKAAQRRRHLPRRPLPARRHPRRDDRRPEPRSPGIGRGDINRGQSSSAPVFGPVLRDCEP